MILALKNDKDLPFSYETLRYSCVSEVAVEFQTSSIRQLCALNGRSNQKPAIATPDLRTAELGRYFAFADDGSCTSLPQRRQPARDRPLNCASPTGRYGR